MKVNILHCDTANSILADTSLLKLCRINDRIRMLQVGDNVVHAVKLHRVLVRIDFVSFPFAGKEHAGSLAVEFCR